MGAKIPSWNGRFIPSKKKHKLGSLSILLHLGGFKFSLREIFGEVRQQIDRKGGLGSPGWKNWKFHLWAGRLRCSHLEGANPSGSARQCFRGKPDSPWAPAWAEFVAHPLLHKLPLLFHVSWKHQWFSIYVWRDLCAALPTDMKQ